MTIHDVLIVGGGPAGSTCARFLCRAGLKVAIVDRATFPKVKLCSGWLSTPVWDTLELSPYAYPGGRWEWHTCHVRYQGEDRAVESHGWFIRRFEFDDFLLRQSGADLHLGVPVSTIERDADGLWSVAGLHARYLVGAGGTHCPVARLLTPPRPMGPVGVQEHEFRANPDAIARTRLGKDGEPELVLHDDLSGYSWNVPKTDWLNIGSGTLDAKNVRAAWENARTYFQSAGHVPTEADTELNAMKGYSYYLYHPSHLERAVGMDPNTGAFLIGDSLGLAHPITAEGILPAVTSGRVLAEAILAQDAANYMLRLANHPVIADYRRVFRMREVAASLRKRISRPSSAPSGKTPNLRGLVSGMTRHWVASGFGWLFSGKALPAPQLIDLALAGAEGWLGPKAEKRP